jgi:hypothetical protein
MTYVNRFYVLLLSINDMQGSLGFHFPDKNDTIFLR